MKLSVATSIAGIPESLPLRECGLKSYIIITFQCHIVVTPLAGVWVEISVIGLSFGNERVTPLAGVWVEIAFTTIYSPGSLVTPLAGVWVEISMLCNAGLLLAGSLPLRECGLKYGNI